MVESVLNGISTALGLTPRQIKLVLRTGWVTLVTFQTLYLFGALAVVGFPAPFAKAAEFASMSAEVTDIKVQLLEQRLFDIRLRQCKAETSESRQYYYTQLVEKMNDYYHMTGRSYMPPSCAEVS